MIRDGKLDGLASLRDYLDIKEGFAKTKDLIKAELGVFDFLESRIEKLGGLVKD